MAPRPNSGLEAHEEEILGDSPLSDRLFHDALKLNESSASNDLEKEKELDEASSIFIGLLTALTLAVLIIAISTLIFRKLRQRNLVLLNEQLHKRRHLEMSSVKPAPSSAPLSGVKPAPSSAPLASQHCQRQPDPLLTKQRRCSTTSSSILPAGTVDADAPSRQCSVTASSAVTGDCRRHSTISVESLSQFVFIPPNQGLSLWRGRARILARHVKRHLLKQEVAIHGCFIPSHCREQLKHIYVY